MKVLVAEKIAESGLKILKDSVHTEIKTGLSHQEILDNIEEYDALVVRSATKVNRELIERGKNLKVIGRAGNGVDNIDLDAATEKGIIIVNTPESNNISTAEHAIALLLACARNIPQAGMSLQSGKWERSSFKGVEIYGKTVVVLGLGRIGSIVASRLKAFGMDVLGYDPYITDERFDKLGIEKVSTINEVMKKADFITIHLPKTEETIGIIGKNEFKSAKKNLRIINCARGGLIDEEALYEALKNGDIAGAALDVFVSEPKENANDKLFTHPLLKLQNLIATPHLGASTTEAQNNVGVAVAQQVIQALKGNIVSAVNLPGLAIKDMKAIIPYIKLAQKLGKIYYQVEKTPVEQVEIVYNGEFSREDSKLITLSFLTGLLEPVSEERVNIVNVEMFTKAIGIEVIESFRNQVEHYTNLITIKIRNKEKEFTVSGTIFAKQEMRIVDFFGYEVDFTPSTYNLMIKNDDKPGVIGQVGTVLGVSGVNIASMKVSRMESDDKALMIINVDSLISKEIVKMLQNIDGISKVNLILL